MEWQKFFQKLIGKEQAEEVPKENQRFIELLDKLNEEVKADGYMSYYAPKISDKPSYEEIRNMDGLAKLEFALFAAEQRFNFVNGQTPWKESDELRKSFICFEAIKLILKSNNGWNEEHIELLVDYFFTHKGSQAIFYAWPIILVLGQIESIAKKNGVSEKLRNFLVKIQESPHFQNQNNAFQKEHRKAQDKIQSILFAPKEENAVRPFEFDESDDFGKFAQQDLNSLEPGIKEAWFALLHHAAKATLAKPTPKYLKTAQSLTEEIGDDAARAVFIRWFEFVCSMKEREQIHRYTWQEREYQHTTYIFLQNISATVLKGMAWMSIFIANKELVTVMARLTERGYSKIPNTGPAAAGVANACIYTLSQIQGTEGLAYLSRIKLKLKQSSARKLIDKMLLEAAKKQGISVKELEDTVVDDHELLNGEKHYAFGEYKAQIKLSEEDKFEIKWLKPDGNPQKSVPAIAKEQFPALLKQLKADAADIQKNYTAQKARIDLMFRNQRCWSYANFQEHYFNHGLLSLISRKLIWSFGKNEERQHAIFLNGLWVNPEGTLTIEFLPETEVRLWHPAEQDVETVRVWRNFLESNQLGQPLKQAWREVYILTPAEVTTRIYSNRMAAHLLRQHQFNALVELRGWKYTLLGSYDHGISNNKAVIELPEYKLNAEFWINEVVDDHSFTDSGIWLYVATDQVRFVNEDGNPEELINIPKVLFSEVMRDVDLFVGVASIGNDPQWTDRGERPEYNQYWHDYSFGNLSEIAKTRKEVLTRLLPRLKIAPVCEIRDRFLIVKGKIKTYKIHIGSTNILMEPNDQYLCIVPDRSAKNPSGVFLPFEGDNGLSIVLSKAFLLAADDKITDPTILTQINRK